MAQLAFLESQRLVILACCNQLWASLEYGGPLFLAAWLSSFFLGDPETSGRPC